MPFLQVQVLTSKSRVGGVFHSRNPRSACQNNALGWGILRCMSCSVFSVKEVDIDSPTFYNSEENRKYKHSE